MPLMPEGKEQFACESIGDYIYCVAGITDGEEETTHSYRLDMSRDEKCWWRIADYPLSVQSCSAENVQGKLIVTGGYDHDNTRYGKYKDTYQYNEQNDQWLRLADMQVAREDHGAAVYDGKLYVFGGITNPYHTIAYNYEIYDSDKNTWTLYEWPSPKALGDFAAVLNDNIIMPCGVQTMRDYPYLTNRSYVDVVVCSGHVVLIGGCETSTRHVLNKVTSNSIVLPDFPYSARGIGACVIRDSIIACGGESLNGQSKRRECYILNINKDD